MSKLRKNGIVGLNGVSRNDRLFGTADDDLLHTRPSRLPSHLQQSVSSAVLGWLWNGGGRRATSPEESRRAGRRPRQHLELLEPRVLLAADLGALSAGLSSYLDRAEATLESKAFNQDLPLVGDNLATTGADFLDQLRTT